MSEPLCPHCSAWEIGPTDAFCGACGGSLCWCRLNHVVEGDDTYLALRVRRSDLKGVLSPLRAVFVSSPAAAEPLQWPRFADWLDQYGEAANDGLGGIRLQTDDDDTVVGLLRCRGTPAGALHLVVDRTGAATPAERLNQVPAAALLGCRSELPPQMDAVHDDALKTVWVRLLPSPSGWIVERARIEFGGGIDGRLEPADGFSMVASARPAHACFLRFGTIADTGMILTDEAYLAIQSGAWSGNIIKTLALKDCKPQELRLYVTPSIRAMAGRYARIGVAVANLGGGSVVVEEIRYCLEGRDVVAVPPGDVFKKLEIGADKRVAGELRPSIENGATGRWALRIEVDINTWEGRKTLVKERTIVVVAPAPFDGTACIDFGTTQTSASVRRGDPNVLEVKNPTTPLELACLRILDDDGRPAYGGDFFLTTAVAIVTEGSKRVWRYGDEAIAAGLEMQRGCLLAQNLKWMLGGDDAYREEYGVGNIDLVRGYLATIRSLIENHPEVAATVDHVYVTKPAVFDKAKEQALVESFTRAGLAVDLIQPTEGVDVNISESWPPLLWLLDKECLEADTPALFKKLDQDEPDKNAALTLDRLKNGAIVVTIDVGGGSSDVSTFRIEPPDQKLRVVEHKARTSTKFTGQAFETLILAAVRSVLADRLSTAMVLDSNAYFQKLKVPFPETLQRRPNTTVPMWRNQRELESLVNTIKNSQGPFWALEAVLVDAVREFVDCIDSGAVATGVPSLRKVVGQKIGALNQRIHDRDPFTAKDNIVSEREFIAFVKFFEHFQVPLVLTAETGQQYRITIDDVALYDILLGAVENVAYTAEHLLELCRTVTAGLALEPERCHVVVAGRGANFRVGYQVISAVVRKVLSVGTTMMKDNDGKTITSLGGLLLPPVLAGSSFEFVARKQEYICLRAPGGFKKPPIRVEFAGGEPQAGRWAVADLQPFAGLEPNKAVMLAVESEDSGLRSLKSFQRRELGAARWLAVFFDSHFNSTRYVFSSARTAEDALAEVSRGKGHPEDGPAPSR